MLNLDAWAKYGTRDLAALLTQPHHSFAALKSIPVRWAEWSEGEPGAVVDKLLSFAHTRAFLSQALEECAALRGDYAGSRSAWQVYRRIRAPFNRSELWALNEGAMATIFSFDAAEEFAQRLRRGTVVEYMWPDYEFYAETQHDFASCPLFPVHDPWLWEEVTRHAERDERAVLREILSEREIDLLNLDTIPEKFRLSRMSFLHPVTDDTATSPLGSVGGYHVGLVFYWEGPHYEEYVFLGPLGTLRWEEQPPVVLRRPCGEGFGCGTENFTTPQPPPKSKRLSRTQAHPTGCAGLAAKASIFFRYATSRQVAECVAAPTSRRNSSSTTPQVSSPSPIMMRF